MMMMMNRVLKDTVDHLERSISTGKDELLTDFRLLSGFNSVVG